MLSAPLWRPGGFTLTVTKLAIKSTWKILFVVLWRVAQRYVCINWEGERSLAARHIDFCRFYNWFWCVCVYDVWVFFFGSILPSVFSSLRPHFCGRPVQKIRWRTWWCVCAVLSCQNGFYNLSCDEKATAIKAYYGYTFIVCYTASLHFKLTV